MRSKLIAWNEFPTWKLIQKEDQYFVKIHTYSSDYKKLLFGDANLCLNGHYSKQKERLIGYTLKVLTPVKRQQTYWFCQLFTDTSVINHSPKLVYNDVHVQLYRFNKGENFNYAFALRLKGKEDRQP